VSSIAHTRGRIHLDDLNLEKAFTGYAAYAQSKLANVMHAMSLADKTALVAYSLHPGVIGTKLLRQGFGPVSGGTTEAGAKTSIRLASAITVDDPSGSYFSEGSATPPATAARDAAAREALWQASARLTHG
jgi:NAD(P)-dependent dehydrogenase (short-subunit alcohol dehydrogenase family)